jgi:hypothetical protein
LQSLLDGHPELLVDVADSSFFNYVPELEQLRDEDKSNYYKNIIMSHIFNKESKYYQELLSHISIKHLMGAFDESCNSRVTSTLKDYFESYIYALGVGSKRELNKHKYFIDKTLKNEYSRFIIPQWWPNVKIIYLFRDPRDVYSSYKTRDKMNNRKITKVDALAFTWEKSVETALYYENKLNESQCLIIKYEDLVSEKKKVMNKVASFLGISYDKILLEPTKGNGTKKWMGNPASGIKKNHVDTREKNKYRTILTNKEINEIEHLLSHQMQSLNYIMENKNTNYYFYPISRFKNKIRHFKINQYESRIITKVL